MPIYEVRSIYTGNRLVSIPFATLSDPLVASSAQIESLIDSANCLTKTLNYRYLEIRTKETAALIRALGPKSSDIYKHHFLPLSAKPEVLYKTFDRSCVRQRISRATAAGLTLRVAETDSEFAQFYRLYAMTRKRLGLPPLPRNFIINMSQLLCSKGLAKAMMAIHGGTPVAALLVFRFRDRVSAEILGSDDTSWRLSPNHFLFWEAIKEACAEGYQVFDFGRTASDNTSLMDFKARWGTQVVDLPIFYLPEDRISNQIDGAVPYYYKFVKSAIQHLPVPFLEKCGSLIYRHRA